MLNNIIDKNIKFLENHGVNLNDTDDKAVYKYGLQILYYSIIDVLVIFSLAAVFGKLYETAIMIVMFAVFQVFGGGYHAKTPLKCLMTMIAGAVAGNIFIILIADKIFISIILVTAVGCAVLILTPVTNKRHPVSTKTKRRSKLIVRAALILIFIILIALSYFNKHIEIAVVAVTLALYLTSLVIAKINSNISKTNENGEATY